MTNHNIVLSVENLSKTYKNIEHETHALKNVSFQLRQGEFLAIMGTSGSGKSTLLNILGALDEPTQGKIRLLGEEMNNMFTEPYASQYRGDYVGFVFQSYHLLKDLNVEENVSLPLILKGIEKDEIIGKTAEVLELVGLTQWRSHRPIQLSGGQQQRVAIARAIISSPPIVLADEPTGNLDFNTSSEILDVLVEMKRKLNQSIILVTHDPRVATYADRVIFFHDGQIVDEYVCEHHHLDVEVILTKFKNMMEMTRC
ncbi:ABC transporter ATP-binding protein [Paenibacillus sp. SN-8-1]|uniref:ABC transporter ATP-binding protein n=1 Tax=Paenibacillus sp. SN-8-1 TaxID=3435409 RepID=UPI003D9A5AC3